MADLLKRSSSTVLLSVVALALAPLGGCGAETASTAATGASIKQREMEEGKKTMERVQREVGKALDQASQRSEKDAEK